MGPIRKEMTTSRVLAKVLIHMAYLWYLQRLSVSNNNCFCELRKLLPVWASGVAGLVYRGSQNQHFVIAS